MDKPVSAISYLARAKHLITSEDRAPDQQDKRSVVSIERGDVERWLQGGLNGAAELLVPPAVEAINREHGIL